MATRPGYIYGGPTDGWVSIGQDAAVNPFKYQATAPTSPATGDIWIDSSSTVNSIDSTQMLRWRKTMAGGETSLSGNDDSSLPLTYTPGYEQLYINGVLQVRGVDYAATTGTTVTGLTALVANDVVEIFSAVARAVSDVYTQSQSDARFVNKSVGGLNLVVPTSVTGGTLSANGQITFSATNSITVRGCFTSSYDNYKVIIGNYTGSNSGGGTSLQFTNGTPSATGYTYSGWNSTVSGSLSNYGSAGTTAFMPAVSPGSNTSFANWEIYGPALSAFTGVKFESYRYTGSIADTYFNVGSHNVATSYDGFVFAGPSVNTISGTIRIYGYNNGA